jgi:carboxypeptidase Taq
MSAQLFMALRAALPNLDTYVRQGIFSPILEWLRQHIYRYGRAWKAAEILQWSTGKPLHAEPWLQYVREKYQVLYPTAFFVA